MSATPFRHFVNRLRFQKRIRVDARSIKELEVARRSQTASAEVNQQTVEWLMSTLSRGRLTSADLM